MTADACAALAGVFSVLLLVVPLEGRSIRASMRSKWAWGLLPAASLLCSAVGIGVTITGVNNHGLGENFYQFAWVMFWIDLFVTALFLFLLVQQETDELAADGSAEDKQARARETGLAHREELGKTWWGRRYLQLTRHGRALPKPLAESPTTD